MSVSGVSPILPNFRVFTQDHHGVEIQVPVYVVSINAYHVSCAVPYGETILGTVAQLGEERNKLFTYKARAGFPIWAFDMELGDIIMAVVKQLMAGLREVMPGTSEVRDEKAWEEKLKVLEIPVSVYISELVEAKDAIFRQIKVEKISSIYVYGIYVIRRFSLSGRPAVSGGIVLPLGGRIVGGTKRLASMLPDGIYEVPSLLGPGKRLAVSGHRALLLGRGVD